MAAQKRTKPVKKTNKQAKIHRPGLLHHRLFIPAVIFMVGIAGVGAYVLTSSSAATGGALSCTFSKTPQYPKAGSPLIVNVSYKNVGGSYWTGSVRPRLLSKESGSNYTTRSSTGGTISGLASGQIKSVNAIITPPSGSNRVVVEHSVSGASLSSNCYVQYNLY